MRKLNKLGKAVVGTVAAVVITTGTMAYASAVVDKVDYKAKVQQQQHEDRMQELQEIREENTIDWNYMNY